MTSVQSASLWDLQGKFPRSGFKLYWNWPSLLSYFPDQGEIPKAC